MNKKQFLDAIRNRIKGLPEHDIDKSLDYYSEMIDDRVEDGMTEEEAVAALGTVDEVNVENKAEIEAVSGDIEFDAFDAGTIEIKTASGDVDGEIITPKNFITDTSSGNVTVPVSESDAGDCVIKTVSGNIIIEVD